MSRNVKDGKKTLDPEVHQPADGIKVANRGVPKFLIVVYITLMAWAVWYAVSVTGPDAGALAGAGSQLSGSPVASGEALFQARCISCHGQGGRGSSVGPDISKAGSLREAAWLTRWLKNPESVQPGAKMPPLGLTDQEIEALVAYLKALK